MKFVLILLFSFPALACSERGRQDFTMKPEALNKCRTLAIQYAMDFAKSIIAQEKKEKDYQGPTTLTPEGASNYRSVKGGAGYSQLVGFNVSLNGPEAKNRWECNYCVDFTVNEKEERRIQTITRFMCAY